MAVLHKTEDVGELRLEFYRRLVGDPSRLEANVLELRSGVETLAMIGGRADSVIFQQGQSLLNAELPDPASSSIVWFNGMNWMKPAHWYVLKRFMDSLAAGGRMLVSFAGESLLAGKDPRLEVSIANGLRQKLGLAPCFVDFNERRIGISEAQGLLKPYSVRRFEHIEQAMDLRDEAFEEWHGGSMRCLFADAPPDHDANLKKAFLGRLRAEYESGHYVPVLSTCLVELAR